MSDLLAGVGTVLAAVFLVPQIGRILVRRDITGLSPSWASVGTLSNLTWLVYLGTNDLWNAMLAPGAALVCYAATLTLVSRRAGFRSWLAAGVVYGTSILTSGLLLGDDGLGIVLAVTPAIQLTPGVVAAYRVTPTGVSSATWAIAVVEAIVWGGYGWIVGDPPLVGYGIITALGSALILGRTWTARPASSVREVALAEV